MIQLLYPHEGLAPGCYSHFLPDEELRLICSGQARAMYSEVPVLSYTQVLALNRGEVRRQDGKIQQLMAPGLKLLVSSSGLVGGAVGRRLESIFCGTAAGTLRIYDNTAASGTVAVEEFELSVGRSDLGIPGRLIEVGCFAVLSDAAARLELYFS
ncbi:MAG: hypothetical protein IV093_03530 [Rubrivivax sp.]|nr:hypothetical protein [Rubrivivax sp.]